MASREDEMSENTKGLTDEELAAQDAEELPDREAMSLINANIAAPVNAAVAANILSDNSVAYANAEQHVNITQSTERQRTSTPTAQRRDGPGVGRPSTVAAPEEPPAVAIADEPTT